MTLLCAIAPRGKWPSAFEEGVRWGAPIQASSRLVMEDTEIRGCLIPKGDTVMTIQASANRDEDVFDDGENYNALRDPNPHQAFGNGPHHCAGAHLSRRTVGAILLPMLFERFPKMTLPEPASVRWHGFGFRGPLNLPVRLKKADYIKFLSLVVPGYNSTLQLNLSYSSDNNKDLYVTASLTAQKDICFKFKGFFTMV